MARYGSDWRFAGNSNNCPYATLTARVNGTFVVFDSQVFKRDIRARLDKHFAEKPEITVIVIEYNHDNGKAAEWFEATRTDVGYVITRRG